MSPAAPGISEEQMRIIRSKFNATAEDLLLFAKTLDKDEDNDEPAFVKVKDETVAEHVAETEGTAALLSASFLTTTNLVYLLIVLFVGKRIHRTARRNNPPQDGDYIIT